MWQGKFLSKILVTSLLGLAPLGLAALAEATKPPPIVTMADVLASQDLLVAMGHVYERDSYHLGEKLKREGVDVDKLKRDPVEVDEKLTAEQVFAANQEHNPQIPTLYSFAPPPIDARTLSQSQTLRLWGLFRIHTMASFVLYKKQCGGRSSIELDEIVAQFAQLPPERRDSALDHEIKAIEARRPYDDAKDQIHIPGGWGWFCKVVNDEIVKHDFDHLFATAMEMDNASRQQRDVR
jgi:hypothetical protein